MDTNREYEFTVESKETKRKLFAPLQPSSSKNTHEKKSNEIREKANERKKKARADEKIEVVEENESSSNEEDIYVEGGSKEWEEVRVEEMQLYLKYLETMLTQTNLILDAMDQRYVKLFSKYCSDGYAVNFFNEVMSRKEEEDRIKPEDYPELAKYVKLGLLEEEAQGNWRVIGNEDAAKLQKKWIHIKHRQLHLSLLKSDLIHDVYGLINDS